MNDDQIDQLADLMGMAENPEDMDSEMMAQMMGAMMPSGINFDPTDPKTMRNIQQSAHYVGEDQADNRKHLKIEFDDVDDVEDINESEEEDKKKKEKISDPYLDDDVDEFSYY